MLQVSLMGYAVGGAFLGLAYYDLYYDLIAVIILLRHYVARELLGSAELGPQRRINSLPRTSAARGSTADHTDDRLSSLA